LGGSRLTRICTYDGAGYAWSDPGPEFDTFDQATHDLHLLLAKAGIRAEVQAHSGISAGNGTEWETEVGTFSLGLSEVFATELSRMGGPFHRSLAMGAKLLPTTAEANQGTPRGSAGVGLQLDSHRFPMLERSGGV
jgi:hypothetical protein